MPGRIYYGWIIVVACTFVASITWGVGIFNQGVFAAYYIKTYGWSPAALSLGPVIFHIWAGIAGVAVGRFIDRKGPKPVLVTGAMFFAAATVAFSLVEEVWQVYPVFLLAGTGFACLHTVTLGKIVARWFVRQRGRAMALATMGAGLGGAVLVPLNVMVIERFNLLSGGLVLAAISLAVILPLALWAIKDSPGDLGLHPDGDAAPVEETVGAETARMESRVWTLAEATRTLPFWGLSFCFALGMLAQSAFLFHQVPYLQASLGMVGAASVVSVTTICGIVGRLGYIAVGDRIPLRLWVGIVFGAQAVSFLLLALGDGPLFLTLGSGLFGLTMGIVVTLQPVVTAFIFGERSFGRIYGPIYMSIRIGSALGPFVVGLFLAAGQGYDGAWFVLAASLALSVALLPWAVRPAAVSARPPT